MLNKLRDYQGQLRKIEEKNAILKTDFSAIQKEYNSNLKVISNLKKDIERLKLNNKGFFISDHAILRYLERVEKVDIKKVKSLILTDNVCQLHKKLGNGEFPSDCGLFKVIIRDNKVITIKV